LLRLREHGFPRRVHACNNVDIRRNRENAGERLGFLGRVIHGTNLRVWLKEVRQRMGEKLDFAETVSDLGRYRRNRSSQTAIGEVLSRWQQTPLEGSEIGSLLANLEERVFQIIRTFAGAERGCL
jgi:hypothetical protein